MSYYGRSSLSSFFGGPVTRTVKLLIIANVAVFLLQFLGSVLEVRGLEALFALRPSSVTHHLTVWQFVTYMFLHGDPFHLFWNMLTLFMFGNDLERQWGTRRFVRYYFITGIGAGVCSWLVGPESPAMTLGASGAIYGLLLAYGVLYPNRVIYLYFLMPVKIKYFVLFIGFLSFYSSLGSTGSGIAHVAHLGGMLVGLAMLKSGHFVTRLRQYQSQRRREALKRQFEIYYPELRQRLEDEKKKGPTIH